MRLLRWWQSLFQGEPLRVLFIGNSLTRFEAPGGAAPVLLNDLPALLTLMARARGSALETAVVARDGATLQEHGEGSETGRLLKPRAFKIVVLQENSQRAILEEAAMAADVRRLDALIRRAGARTALFSTWPPAGRSQAGERLGQAYAELAEELGALRVPVAEAWTRATKGRPELKLQMKDGVHATALGAYLSACVFYERFFPGRLNAPTESLESELAAVEGFALAQSRCAGEGLLPAGMDAALAYLRSVAAAVCAPESDVQSAVVSRDAAPAEYPGIAGGPAA